MSRVGRKWHAGLVIVALVAGRSRASSAMNAPDASLASDVFATPETLSAIFPSAKPARFDGIVLSGILAALIAQAECGLR